VVTRSLRDSGLSQKMTLPQGENGSSNRAQSIFDKHRREGDRWSPLRFPERSQAPLENNFNTGHAALGYEIPSHRAD
jgi:hypothetical protein